jgi:curli biogenesis system outer membrane secretion channel CsgG
MRFIISIVLILFLAFCGFAQEQSQPRPRKRLAIVSFETAGDWTRTQLGQVLADMIITELVKQGSVEVVERAELDALLKEQRLAAEGVLDAATVARSGRILGIDYILGGKVTQAGFTRKDAGGFATVVGVNVEKATARVALDTRLIDAETGRIITVSAGEGEEKNSGLMLLASDFNRLFVGGRFNTKEWESSMLGKAARKAVTQVVKPYLEFFPVEFAVLAVSEDTGIVVEGGKLQGLKKGDQLALARLVTIRNSKGDVVFSERVTYGRAEITDVQEDRSKAKVLEGVPKEGDVAFPDRR